MPQLTIRRHAEMLKLIPEILGFHPEESLVSLVLCAGVVKVTARIDFPARPGSPDCWQAAESVARIWRPFAPAHGFLLAYTERSDPWSVLRALAGSTHADPLWLVHVGQGSWRVNGAGGPSGSYLPQPDGPLRRPFRATRADLAQTVLPLGDEAGAAGLVAKQQAKLSRLPRQCWGERLSALLTDYDPGMGLPALKCAQAAVLVCDGPARGVAIAAIQRANAVRMGEFWGEVVRRVPDSHQLHPLGLLGLAAWVSGNGALQMICLERAEALLGLDFHQLLAGYCARDPTVPALIGMNAWINFNVLHPTIWDQLREAACAKPGGPSPSGAEASTDAV
ncbi:MAG: DUF4192 domain-containing protein [Propionibacteriaceae bacterium]|nr:DUF4192 domain-containing protein [Propionibacteriaceae bacterium]